jgi:hypothetical protein
MCLPTQAPVQKEWIFAGLNCAITRVGEYGHLCGYVRVPPGHPLHGKGHMDDPRVDALSAHGGVNFSEIEPCTHDDGTGWWFGFDCAHAQDARRDPDSPPNELFGVGEAYLGRIDAFERQGHYWTLPDVVAEVEFLAIQLVAEQVIDAVNHEIP